MKHDFYLTGAEAVGSGGGVDIKGDAIVGRASFNNRADDPEIA